MVSYKLPAGIRIPEDSDYPNGENVAEINRKRDAANIVEGFNITHVKGEIFSYYSEANIDADKLWDVFVYIVKSLVPENAYGIIAHREDEPKYSDYTAIDRILNIFSEFKYELINDGFLEFGIASKNKESYNEVFVTSFKYMRIYSSDSKKLVDAFKKLKIKKIKKLQFIDEFATASYALKADDENKIRNYSEVIERIESAFNQLNKQ